MGVRAESPASKHSFLNKVGVHGNGKIHGLVVTGQQRARGARCQEVVE